MADSILAHNSRWNINNNIDFHFILFPGKNNDKISQKNPILESLGNCLPKFGQKLIFPEKSKFLCFPIYFSKYQKKIMIHSWKKCRTDKRTGRETDRQTDRHTERHTEKRWFYRTLRRTRSKNVKSLIYYSGWVLRNGLS